MSESEIATELDCLREIANRTIAALPPAWTVAGVDVVRQSDTSASYRCYYLEAASDERFSFDIDLTTERLFRKLARLASTEEKGLYKKLRFTLKRAGAATSFDVRYEYDDETPGFIGSNGELLDFDFFNQRGPVEA